MNYPHRLGKLADWLERYGIQCHVIGNSLLHLDSEYRLVEMPKTVWQLREYFNLAY